jgi:acetyl coenzyme A synthetase (ADP forming)-like protein
MASDMLADEGHEAEVGSTIGKTGGVGVVTAMAVERPKLDAVFRPRGIAVIGASRRRGTIAGEVFHNLLTSGFPGAVYPVNTAASSVQSVEAYASVRDIPGQVDLAVIVLPAARVLAAVDECGACGVRGVVVISAGFAEMGAEGQERQDELRRRVRAHGMVMIGPNCLGVLNTEADSRVNATFSPTFPPPGCVAVASQSGAVGLAVLDYARDLGIGISQFASTGNKADISGNDLLAYWENDPATKVVLLYLESFGNPRRFMEIAGRVSRQKPIVVVKSGRTAAGARAASSHTGALAGMDIAVDALLGQAGVLRADTMEEMFDLASLLANQPVPAGARVAIVTNAGGLGIMASDACESHGLELPHLSVATVASLRAFIAPEASVRNPIDMLAAASPEDYERTLQLVLADENIDAVIVLFVPPLVTDPMRVAQAVERGAGAATKPVLTCLVGTHGVSDALASLRAAKLPGYAFPEQAALALARAVRYGAWLRRPAGATPALEGCDRGEAAKVLGGGRTGWLAPEEVRRVLSAYGVQGPRSAIAHDADDAAAAADRIGYPVALKLVSREIVHKSDVGGVFLRLPDREGVRRAFRELERRLEARGMRGAMEGVLVQEMVEGGVETYVGVTQAPGFGALVAFGIGGVNIEVWRDVAFRVHPLTDVDASDMLTQIRGRVLLEGFRGAPAVDRAALAETILRIDRLLADFPAIEELDINPLLARPAGGGVVALDARIRVGAPRK